MISAGAGIVRVAAGGPSRARSSEGRDHFRPRMQKLLIMLGMTVGGYVGWAIGAPAGIFTAFVVSMIGSGAGVYAARLLLNRLVS